MIFLGIHNDSGYEYTAAFFTENEIFKGLRGGACRNSIESDQYKGNCNTSEFLAIPVG